MDESKKPIKNNDELSDDLFNVSSTNDCTGLIPAGLNNEAELDAYEKLYDFMATISDVNDTIKDKKKID